MEKRDCRKDLRSTARQMLNVLCNRWISHRELSKCYHRNAEMISELPGAERGVGGKFELVAHVKRDLVGE